MTLMTGDEKHGPSATSTLDVLWVLYDRVLRVDPRRADDPDRDRFLLSKGHGPMAYYAVLAAKGFLTGRRPAQLRASDSTLGYHPDRTLRPGVEISAGRSATGSALAVGTALGLRVAGLHRPGRRARRRRGTGGGHQHGGDPVRRTRRAGQPDRRRDRQLVRSLGLARRHRGGGSPSRAGRPSTSTAATTTRWNARSDRRPAGRTP